MRSPKSCVTSFTYGVSPQPAHAPENSNRGFLNWLSLTVLTFNSPWNSGSFCANSQFADSSFWLSRGFMISAFSFAGQTCAQLPQPVQSYGLTWMRYWWPLKRGPIAGFILNASGTAAMSASGTRYGRMTACGQTSAQLLHCMQLSICHSGTLTAMPRFSYFVVPVGTRPAGSNAETGSLSPSCASTGWMTWSKYSVASTFTGSAPVVALAQAAGTGISTRPEIAMSIASQFCLTTASPFLP